MNMSTLKSQRFAEGKRAFTLIELIVVIVIIGILAAVAAVSYNSFIAGANESAAESTYSQIGKLVQADSALNQAVSADVAYDAVTDGAFSTLAPTVGYAADMPDNVEVFQVSTGVVTATIDGLACIGLTNTGTGQVSGDISCA